MIKELDKNYKDTLSKEKQPYLLEIYTPSCGICQQVMPFVEQVEAEYGDKYAFYKLNAEEIPSVGKEYGITSVPTLLFVKEGKIINTHHGYITKEDIIKKLKESFE